MADALRLSDDFLDWTRLTRLCTEAAKDLHVLHGLG